MSNIRNTLEKGTPYEMHGRLQVKGTKLCNQKGEPIQLRGMSTHGLQWHGWGKSISPESLDVLAYDWGADILRISMYVQEGGYETAPEVFTEQVHQLIEEVTNRGMYALVDWHQLTPGDPVYNIELAKVFFSEMTKRHADKTNIIYEIANEPNGCEWSTIRDYAHHIIPVIRKNDSNAVVLVGTHGWGSLGVSDGKNAREIVSNPVEFENIMYTFHFYAASHKDEYRKELAWASDRLPIFVSEWGSQEYTGDGPNDFNSTTAYLDLLEKKKISWVNWNYSDNHLSGAVWKEGTSLTGKWTVENLKEAGLWVRDKLKNR